MNTKVKICGITNKEDAIWALNYGADYLGLNFFKGSPRHVTVNSSAWVKELPPFAQLVAVMVDAPIKDVLNLVQHVPLKGIQFHGDETPEYIRDVRFQWEGLNKKLFVIKAFRIQDEKSLESLASYMDVVDYFLLDTYSVDQKGGTGKVFNWDLALKASELKKPIFLAGGLNSDNVKSAVGKVHPFAVDAASGVEKSARKKDNEKIHQFINNAKQQS